MDLIISLSENVVRYNINQEGQPSQPFNQQKQQAPSNKPSQNNLLSEKIINYQDYGNNQYNQNALFADANQQAAKSRLNTANGQRSNQKASQNNYPNQNIPVSLFGEQQKPTTQVPSSQGRNLINTQITNASKGKLTSNQVHSKPNDADGFSRMTKEEILGWKATSEEDLHKMSQKHEQLIGQILSEEEEVIGLHRQHIDDMVELIKQV